MVGPSAAARATPVVVVTKSRRLIPFRLVMDLPPCVLFHRPFMAGQNRFAGPSPQGVTAGPQAGPEVGVVCRAATKKGTPGGARGDAPPRQRRVSARARPRAPGDGA